MSSAVKLSGGTLADMPDELEGREHYVAVDQTPAQLYVGPPGGGFPKLVGGKAATKSFVSKTQFASGSGDQSVIHWNNGSTLEGTVAHSDFHEILVNYNATPSSLTLDTFFDQSDGDNISAFDTVGMWIWLRWMTADKSQSGSVVKDPLEIVIENPLLVDGLPSSSTLHVHLWIEYYEGL